MYNFLVMGTISSVVLVLIFLFISFFCLFLFIENHKLKEKIKGLELENKRLLEIKISKQKNIDSIPINKISNNDKKISNQNNKKIELVQKSIPKEQPKIKEEKKLYQKNVFHEKPNITSPVSLTNTKIENDSFELNDFIKNNELKIENNKKNISDNELNINKKSMLKEEKTEKIQTNNKNNGNIEYLQEISDKIANELQPQTIELTDYEKIQEENAIISYKELITLKDTIKMLDDEDETINFIEELKKLRNSLK